MPRTVLGTVAMVAKKTDAVMTFTEFTIRQSRLNQQVSDDSFYSLPCVVYTAGAQ